MPLISFWFFKEVDLTSEYQRVDFNSNVRNLRGLSIVLVSDSNDRIDFSWDGNKLDGFLKPKEVLEIDNIKRNKIFIKGSDSMRVWVHEIKPKE
jgi:hypothetical protein